MSSFKSLLAAATVGCGAANSYAAPVVIDTNSFGGHTYKLLSSDTWTMSEAFAQSALGAHLVTIDDALENAFVIARFGSQQYAHTYTDGTWNDLGNFSDYAGPKFGVVELVEQSVPEPATMSFLGAGVLLGGVLRRRAKRIG